jgi:hypothetical protein
VDQWLPGPQSIINVKDFGSPKELANFLLQLDQVGLHVVKVTAIKSPGIRTMSGMTNTLVGRSYPIQSPSRQDLQIAPFMRNAISVLLWQKERQPCPWEPQLVRSIDNLVFS